MEARCEPVSHSERLWAKHLRSYGLPYEPETEIAESIDPLETTCEEFCSMVLPTLSFIVMQDIAWVMSKKVMVGTRRDADAVFCCKFHHQDTPLSKCCPYEFLIRPRRVICRSEAKWAKEALCALLEHTMRTHSEHWSEIAKDLILARMDEESHDKKSSLGLACWIDSPFSPLPTTLRRDLHATRRTLQRMHMLEQAEARVVELRTGKKKRKSAEDDTDEEKPSPSSSCGSKLFVSVSRKYAGVSIHAYPPPLPRKSVIDIAVNAVLTNQLAFLAMMMPGRYIYYFHRVLSRVDYNLADIIAVPVLQEFMKVRQAMWLEDLADYTGSLPTVLTGIIDEYVGISNMTFCACPEVLLLVQ